MFSFVESTFVAKVELHEACIYKTIMLFEKLFSTNRSYFYQQWLSLTVREI